MAELKRYFTLVEVVVALAILGLSLAGLLSLAMNAQVKVARAVEKWENTHKMIQAVEYVMLFDDENLNVPAEFFPYEGYSVQCSVDDAEGLPEEFTEIDDAAPLKCITVELVRGRDNKVVDRVKIDRINFESEE
ncbi:MAG: prepilin-type N-terminal cleavage/methylation domain-containing protein [Lentisphaerae bacterium]|nr:prepilin-type N-terminal cleavage/methylation domain-containing protein [Lentisphaerota bacterium]